MGPFPFIVSQDGERYGTSLRYRVCFLILQNICSKHFSLRFMREMAHRNLNRYSCEMSVTFVEFKPKLQCKHFFFVKGFTIKFRALPWFRRLVASLSLRRPWFDPGPVHVVFLVDKVAARQVFHRVLRFLCHHHCTISSFSYVIHLPPVA
jgi:hypothetical protein